MVLRPYSMRSSAFIVLLTGVVNGCAQQQIAASREGVGTYSIDVPLGLVSPTFPSGTPPAAAEVALGQELFFDPVLSLDGTVSCASCHSPDHAFADPRPKSVGVRERIGRRNSPTVLNAALSDRLSWDGQHASLEEQTLAAISNPEEMALEREQIPSRVRKRYGRALIHSYGEISAEAVAAAISAYQRTLLAGDSPFDRYIYLGDQSAISETARKGFEVFTRKGRCIQCHMVRCEECHPFGGRTAFFINNRFHNLGVGFDSLGVRPPTDLGRSEVTRQAEEDGAFRTPSLRNVALTAPYMHDGSLATLRDVVDHYDRGGIRNSRLDPEIRPLNLTEEEKVALVAYLETLTSTSLPPDPRRRTPSEP